MLLTGILIFSLVTRTSITLYFNEVNSSEITNNFACTAFLIVLISL